MNILIANKVKQFNEHLKKSACEFATACRIYAEAVKDGGIEAHNEFAKAHPQITDTMWRRMRLCGEGHVLPEIVIVGTDSSFKKLAAIPIEKQRKLVGAPIEVASRVGRHVVVKKVKVSILKEHEISKAISSDGEVIPLSKQIEVLSPEKIPYEIKGNVLKVNIACTISYRELELIVLKMRG